MKTTLLILMAVVVVSCGVVGSPGIASLERKIKANNSNMAKLSVGMTKAQVLEIMGPAGRTEAYESKTGGGGSHHEFLMYRSKLANPFDAKYDAANATDAHWTPICIVDGKLKGWGRNFYDDTIRTP